MIKTASIPEPVWPQLPAGDQSQRFSDQRIGHRRRAKTKVWST